MLYNKRPTGTKMSDGQLLFAFFPDFSFLPAGEQAHMEAAKSDTIVGINAPIDLSGRTPLAWSVRSRTRNKRVRFKQVPVVYSNTLKMMMSFRNSF